MTLQGELSMDLKGNKIISILCLCPRSEDPLRRQNVESFIQSRLAQVAGGGCRSKCSALVSGLEESLECPVCRDRVSGHVYQCHAGHVMW